MRAENRFHSVVGCLFAAIFFTLPSFAQTAQNLNCSPMAAARIAGSIDDNVLANLQGNIHPLALADYDEGRIDDNLPLEHIIIMMLRRSSVQETALATRIDQMHNQRLPYYHQWLSAEDVGRCYGVADSDIAVVTDWLQRHGFKIDTLPAGKTMIIFRRCLLLGYMSLPNFVQNLKPVPPLCLHPQPPLASAMRYQKRNFLRFGKRNFSRCGDILTVLLEKALREPQYCSQFPQLGGTSPSNPTLDPRFSGGEPYERRPRARVACCLPGCSIRRVQCGPRDGTPKGVVRHDQTAG
jgi:hypothetical protein